MMWSMAHMLLEITTEPQSALIDSSVVMVNILTKHDSEFEPLQRP